MASVAISAPKHSVMINAPARNTIMVTAVGSPGSPGPTAVSTDEGNAAILGSDNLIYVPVNMAGGITDHQQLTGRSTTDSHPIGAITNLQTTLNNKSDTTHNHVGVYDPAGTAQAYLLDANSYTDSELVIMGGYVDTSISNHESKIDPHSQYLIVDDITAGTNVTLDKVDNSITINATGTGGTTDHGALTGLGDDDHPQYLLANGMSSAGGHLTVPTALTVDGTIGVTAHRVTLAQDPTDDSEATTKGYVDGAIATHSADHADYLTAGELIAGANVNITNNGDGTVTIASTGGSGSVYEEGVIEFDDPTFAGADDDATLDNIMAYAAAQAYKPTIRLRAGLTTLNNSHTIYTGFKLIGAGGNVPVEQVRTGAPYASLVDCNQTTGYVFNLPAGNTHGVVIQGISWEGGANTSWLGSTNGGVLWTSTLRDLAFSAFYSVLGKRSEKLLNTAILCDGWWNINNARHTSITVGGSDSIFWVGSNFLMDSPTTLNTNISEHIYFNYQEKSVVGGAFVTAEQRPAAMRIDGSRNSGALIFQGMRFEGRNAGAPSYGSVIRITGGNSIFRDCWISFGYADPASSGRTGELGVVTVLGGEVLFDGCFYAKANAVSTSTPWIAADGASTKVTVRHARTADDGGAWGDTLPLIAASNSAKVDVDYSAIDNYGFSGQRWRMWSGTQAEYDAIGSYAPNTLYVIVG